MPYRNAHWWLLVLIAFTIFGFWENFFSKIGSPDFGKEWQAQLHTWPALLWMLLMVVQVWSIHNKKFRIHRACGQLSLILFPFVIAGLVAIINFSADTFEKYLGSPFNILGPPLFFQASIPIIAFLAFYYLALANRSNVYAHSGYLLAMPIFLIESPVSRVLKQYTNWFTGEGVARFESIISAIQAGLIIAVIVALIIWLFDREKRKPFLIVAVLSFVQWIAIQFLSDLKILETILLSIAKTPSWINITAGFIAGSLVSIFGWRAGKSKP